ncbi:MAG: heme ABC transporter ATP-binding protein [Chloroflexota bacterium]
MSLEARAITVNVGQKTLVDDVSLTVESGEIVAIIGPNGAGKSTLLKALSGDIRPDHGDVRMGGRPLSQWKLRDRARVRGILAQNVNLLFAFTALEVVLMGRGPHLRGQETHYDYAIARDALATVEVLHLEDRVFTTLSGGERQRVQLARVLAQIWEPVRDATRYLLMDEPTNNLDLAHQHRALRVARRFADEGVAVLVILHDLNLAAQYADRIAIMRGGRMLTEGVPNEVLTAPNIQAAFDVPVAVTRHPFLDRPLIVPIAGALREIDSATSQFEISGLWPQAAINTKEDSS